MLDGAYRINIRDNRWRADFQRLRNYWVPCFPTSGDVSEPLAERPGLGQPGADPPRDDHGRGVVGMGHTGPKDSEQHEWSP